MQKYKTIFILIGLLSASGHSQVCNDYNNFTQFVNCRKCINSYYKIYMEPKHTSVAINDTLKYNVVFQGNRDYIISFCADQIYYPLNIRLFEPITKRKLYDNTSGDYKQSIKVGINNTQNILVEVIFLADQVNKNKAINKNACVSFIMQWRKLKKNRINDIGYDLD